MPEFEKLQALPPPLAAAVLAMALFYTNFSSPLWWENRFDPESLVVATMFDAVFRFPGTGDPGAKAPMTPRRIRDLQIALPIMEPRKLLRVLRFGAGNYGVYFGKYRYEFLSIKVIYCLSLMEFKP